MQGFILQKLYLKSRLALALVLAGNAAWLCAADRPANHVVRAELPPLLAVEPAHKLPPLRLVAAARHAKNLVPENSSLEKCAKAEDTFWTINDSESGPYLFAITSQGRVLQPTFPQKKYRGILLTGRRNIDWEAIAADESGNLIVADVGNNRSNRRNLCFYIVPEPDPHAEQTAASRKVSFYYPTQDEFPSPSRNFDCESCFALNGFIYFFTKQWSNTETVLWRVDPAVEDYQAAVPVARFNVRGLVTDAALSASRDRLAILTYHAVWLFELPAVNPQGKRDESKFFANPRFRKIAVPFADWQLEGIAFIDDSTLLLSSESGALFRLPIDELK